VLEHAVALAGVRVPEADGVVVAGGGEDYLVACQTGDHCRRLLGVVSEREVVECGSVGWNGF